MFGDERDNLGFARINGKKTPGRLILSPPKDTVLYQNSQGFAFSGPVTVYQGTEVARFTAQFVLDRAQMLVFAREIRPMLRKPVPPERPKAVDIVHPYTALQGVRQVATLSLEGPFWDIRDFKGAYIVNWEFQEFAPRKPLPPRLQDAVRPFEGAGKQLTETQKAIAATEQENANLRNYRRGG